ncbi:hypothetical protein PG994_008536 [Apiospora phragmitis]|uniref:Uncharacterized protein n=1 Tax=Apiospora phragmitis TaxID=2905665 RepID=A0ABR1UGS4_9PEZI
MLNIVSGASFLKSPGVFFRDLVASDLAGGLLLAAGLDLFSLLRLGRYCWLVEHATGFRLVADFLHHLHNFRFRWGLFLAAFSPGFLVAFLDPLRALRLAGRRASGTFFGLDSLEYSGEEPFQLLGSFDDRSWAAGAVRGPRPPQAPTQMRRVP